MSHQFKTTLNRETEIPVVIHFYFEDELIVIDEVRGAVTGALIEITRGERQDLSDDIYNEDFSCNRARVC
jgi:hypothetical protein